MPHLILIRHAKSDWGTAQTADFDRPLADRGRHAMPRVATELRTRGLVPDSIVCSTAQRARETLALALEHWNSDMRIVMTRAIYEADSQALLEIARDAASTNPKVLAVIGHNPAMEDCAGELAGCQSDQDALRDLAMKYPTAACAIFEGNWSDLKIGGMRLQAFIVPRNLSEV